MSIASQIDALTTDRNNIRTALVVKGISAASSHGFDDFAQDINNIPSSGGTAFKINNPLNGGTTFMTASTASYVYNTNKKVYIAYLLYLSGGWGGDTQKKGIDYPIYSYGCVSGTVAGDYSGAAPTVADFKNGLGNNATKYSSIGVNHTGTAVFKIEHTSGPSSTYDFFTISKTADAYASGSSYTRCYTVLVVMVSGDGELAFDLVNVGGVQGCFSTDTLITLADGSTKRAGDITYNDDLLSWDFDKGCQCSTKPLWIKRVEKAPIYQLVKLKSGKEIKFVGPTETGNCHRIFCTDTNRFEYVPNMIGKHTIINGEEDIVESWSWIPEEIEYTNIVADYHMCIYTNDILTSCRRSNVYPIENMKYVKDERPLRTIEDYEEVPKEFFDGLRLAEQTRDVGEISFYVENMINGMKPKE